MTQFRALPIKLGGKCFYNICVHKISNAISRKCLTLTKGIHMTIFGQCNRKLSSTSNLFNSNSTKNINFLQNKSVRHTLKKKKILLNLPTAMYKLNNYLHTPKCYFSILFCKLSEFQGRSVQGYLAKIPRTSCEVETFLWITETKEKPVAI